GLIITLKNAWTTSRRVNFLWVANFNLKFGIPNLIFRNFLFGKNLLTMFLRIWYYIRWYFLLLVSQKCTETC
ncbi:hypothetical protein EFM91_09220, partial [Streptococcus thermophilus]|nr:hypothetical protein [Streptococcus thermophilus]